MAIARGAKAAEEEAKRSRPNFGKADFFTLKENESALIRLIEPGSEWAYTKQHSFVPTRSAPPDADQKVKDNWPKRMGAVCRRDKSFEGKFPDCFICDHLRKDDGKRYGNPVRMWVRAVMREAVVATPEMVAAHEKLTEAQIGTVVGYRDVIVEEQETDANDEPTGNVIKRPKVVIINLSMDNFFGYIQGYEDVYGNVLNRDFHVTRKGGGTETDYSVVPMDPTPNHDLAHPETRKQYELYAAQAHLSLDQVDKMIEDRASDDFYARYFDTRVPQPAFKNKKKGEGKGDSGDATASTPPAAPAEQQTKPPEPAANAEALERMRERVRNAHKAATGGAESSAPTSPAQETPAPPSTAAEPAPAVSASAESAPTAPVNFSS